MTPDDEAATNAFAVRPNVSAPKVLIAFYSRGGAIEQLALAIAEGAASVGAETRLRRARELVAEDVMARAPGWRDNAKRMNEAYAAPALDDALWADALVFGAPTRFGAGSSELRAYIETLGMLWVNGKLNNKAGSAFTSASAPHGGVETTILGMWPTLAHLNLVIVPTGYGHPAVSRAGTPYGAASLSYAAEQRKPTEADLEVARYQGERVARVAQVLRALHQPPNLDT